MMRGWPCASLRWRQKTCRASRVAGAFTNPVDALAYVQEHPVEAAFLDIAMPGMNGLALAEKLREIRPDLVVIFLTGYEQYTLDALKVKADYYLTKPYNKQDITEALERARLLAARQKKRGLRAHLRPV